MSSLLAHTFKQQISLPVACFFVFVQTASQFFKLQTCWGLNDGRARRGERLSGSPGMTLACLQRTSSAISATLCSDCIGLPFLHRFGLLL